MNKTNKIQEAEVQLEIREHYQPLRAPMVKTIQIKVNKIIEKLHRSKHIDDMTKNGFLKPAGLEFLSSTRSQKIHKPAPVGRPIISGCDGPTERIPSFVDTLLQPIAQKQQSYIKDTTDVINSIEKPKIGKDTILVAMDVPSL